MRAQLEANKNIFLAGYEKMKVGQDFELRKTVRGAGGTYKVIKNRIAEKAAEGASGRGPVEGIEGHVRHRLYLGRSGGAGQRR